MELAHDEVKRRSHQQTILSSYLIGSVVHGNPFLGDAADIDLVIIHNDDVRHPREFIRLSQQVHLDISHINASFFEHPRQLRIDPWQGPAIAEPGFLYDPDHFFERVQATVRGQFYRPDFVFQRATGFLNLAKQHCSLMQISSRWPHHYLHAIILGANARLACFNSQVAGRGTLAALRSQLHKLGETATYHGIVQLCGLADCTSWDFDALLSALDATWRGMQKNLSQSPLSRCRKEYTLAGLQGLLDQQDLPAAGWLLVMAWELLHARAEAESVPMQHEDVWDQLRNMTSLRKVDRRQRKQVLTRYLNHIGTQLHVWGKEHGV